MQVALGMYLDTRLYDLTEHREAFDVAYQSGGTIYTWKTVGRENWLDHGASILDALGLVVLTRGLPQQIDMPDDPPEPGDEEETD